MSSVMSDRWPRTPDGTMPLRSETHEFFRCGGPGTYAGMAPPEPEEYALVVGPDNAIPTPGIDSVTRLVVLLFPLVKCELYTVFR